MLNWITMEVENTLRRLLGDELRICEPMSRHTTLKVGGPARCFWAARDIDRLVAVLKSCHDLPIPYLFIGHGSNLLMADTGYDGLVIQNKCKGLEVGPITTCESGVTLGSLFQMTARSGFGGLEWAVGIPGTVGGALVSNAGAYRGNIGPLVKSVRIFHEGADKTEAAEWMQFSYRDSRLRRNPSDPVVLLSCLLELRYEGDPEAILSRAKSYREQRRIKQPFEPSAGSFFKNVLDWPLAQRLESLPAAMKEAGVVPAGYLIESCGLKGARIGGAGVSQKHANFLINAGGDAAAADLRRLADMVKQRVFDKYGVTLEEEVLYCGDWSGWPRESS